MLNQPYWQNYRLGDIIKGWFIEVQKLHYHQQTIKKWPSSIGSMYILRTNSNKVKKKKNNYRILQEIIEGKIKKDDFPIPNKNNIVLHLRLGDVIRSYNKKTKLFGVKDNFEYVTKLHKLEKCLNELDSKKKIILVYGSHKRDIQSEPNHIYLEKVKNLLKSKNFAIREKFSGNPDKDFVFMCKARIFIKSGGGFSSLIAHMVKKNNGTVIDPIF